MLPRNNYSSREERTMLARFTNKPLALALIAGTVLSIVLFAAFHRVTGGERDNLARAIVTAANPVVERLTTVQPSTVGRVTVADAPLIAAGGPVAQPVPMPAQRQKARMQRPRRERGPSRFFGTENLIIKTP